MIKFYKNGEEFLKDNIVILNQYPLDTSFFKVNSKLLNTFDRRNYSFKVIDGNNYLLVMRLDDYNLLLFGETNLVKEAIDIICDYHLYFYGILASKELINELIQLGVYSCNNKNHIFVHLTHLSIILLNNY